MLVAALVITLPLRLRPHLLHEGRAGLDFDEVEDPFHGRLEILGEVRVSDYAEVPFRDEPRSMRFVKGAEQLARGLVEVLDPAALALLARRLPDVVPVLEHACHERHTGRDDLDRLTNDGHELPVGGGVRPRTHRTTEST